MGEPVNEKPLTYSSKCAGLPCRVLFGIWHIVMPIRSYINGEMPYAEMILMSIGYVILAGILMVVEEFLPEFDCLFL